jgi:sec-independent protein translocase protein TatC
MAEDPIDRVRAVVTDRAELPGMTLMEHLEELRKRLIQAVLYLLGGVAVTSIFHERLLRYIQMPLFDSGLKLTQTHPTDALEFLVKTSLISGAIVASPFILYQLWLFISPGMYAHEKKYVFPFMSATVGLFLGGAWFGYRWVLPDAIKVLVLQFGKDYNHLIGIEEYTGFSLAIILGLGICFELPILMFFLSLFGIVDHKFFLKQWRYAILAVFLVAAIICPLPDPIGMCLFASPMLALYFVGVLAAYYVHPSRRKPASANKEITPA